MTTDENLSMTPDNDKAPQRRKRPRKGPIVGILLLLFLLAGIGAGAWWYLFLRFEESTDDAYVAGNVLRIMPQVSGKVVAVDVDDNDMVAAGQTLVRLDPVDARLAYERSLVALASAVRDNCRLQAQLRETEAAIRMRRVDLRQKADNLTRREALGKAKAIGAEELKHARDDRENAAVALAAAEEERKQRMQPRPYPNEIPSHYKDGSLVVLDKGIGYIRNIQFAILERLRYPNVIREEIERLLENITVLAEAAALATSPALTDELVSHGELMSTLLFVEILRERDVQAQWFDVRKVMRTNDRFGRAEPDIAALAELAALQLLPRLNEGLVITQGFIGSENKGRTTTLGRGGSDYTAALLAEALHASRVDIWTDVPGIYTTDPRVVSAAKRIDEIAFAEAAEMATFGAKVLHPATLLPAVRSDIPVFVGSSKDPRAGGTLVCNKTENPPLFRALALRRNQTLLTLHSLNMLHSRGFLAEVFGILARHNISVDLITTSEVSVALTLDTTGSTSTGDTLLTQSLLMELSALCRVEVEEGLALVALIGNDLSKACGVGKEVFGVLEPFNIRMICYGASSHNLCFLVPGEDAEQVVQKLHSNLFE